MEKLTLAQKISKIQNMSVEIQKSAKNEFQKYSYKTFTDIKRAVMKKMEEYEISIYPSGNLKDLIITNNTVSYNRTIIVRSGEDSIEVDWFFVGKNDDIAKAHGSAITYGLKYFFNQLWLLPDETLDPDTTEISKKTNNKPSSSTEESRRMLLIEKAKSNLEMRDILKNKYNIHSLGDLNKLNINTIDELLKGDN